MSLEDAKCNIKKILKDIDYHKQNGTYTFKKRKRRTKVDK